MKSISFLIFLFCAAGFIGVNTGCTDDSGSTVTVGDVASGKATLEDFTMHAASRLSESRSFDEVLGLLKDFRDETGDWNDGETYLILLTSGGGVYIHPKERELEDQDWSGRLVGCSGESWNDLVSGGGGCVMGQGEQSQGYAVSFAAPYVPFSNPHPQSDEPGFVLVGGLDYTPPADTHGSFNEMVNDLVDRFVKRFGDDPINPEDRKRLTDTFFEAVTPEVNSMDVGRDDLQSYLEEAYTFMTASFHIPLFDPVILRRVFRFEGGPWRNLSTYIYITDEKGNVIFNAANRNIEQSNLVRGDFGEEIAGIMERIIEAATTKGPTGSFTGGFVEYNWDDPSIEGDEGDGAGGTSPKLGFAKAFTVDKNESVDTPPRIYIFGTGLYNPTPSDGAEGGTR